MAYKVITTFTDLQDNHHRYLAGDLFPRNGKTVSDARIAELSSTNNRRGIALIEPIVEKAPEADLEPKTETKKKSTATTAAKSKKNVK